jgi:hypothetical protein
MMAKFYLSLRRWAHDRRIALRMLFAIAALALLFDGYQMIDRSVGHLLLLHPILLLALMFGVVLTEDLDSPEARDES